jgi:hypothetical protein
LVFYFHLLIFAVCLLICFLLPTGSCFVTWNVGLGTWDWWSEGERGHKPIPAPVLGLDERLSIAVIAQRLARRGDTASERGFAHDLSRPECVKQFVFGDEPVTMLDEIGQHVEDFTVEFERLAGAAQFVELFVEFVVAKNVAHDNKEDREPFVLSVSAPTIPTEILCWQAATKGSGDEKPWLFASQHYCLWSLGIDW